MPVRGVLSVKYPIEGQLIEVFPTSFAEAAFCLMLFVFMQLFLKTWKRGVTTSVYCICYAPYRFIIEWMRGDAVRGYYGDLTSSQWMSIVMFGCGISVFVSGMKKAIANDLFEHEKENG